MLYKGKPLLNVGGPINSEDVQNAVKDIMELLLGISHSEGNNTIANEYYPHAEGAYTVATNICSHAQGHYNATMVKGGDINNTTGTAFVIGNGTSEKSFIKCIFGTIQRRG